MELGTEKSTIMTTSTSSIGADIGINGQKLEAVTSLKYMGAIPCNDGTCSAEIRCRIDSAMTAMAGLIRIWRSNTLSLTSKFKLYTSPVISVFLWDWEIWTPAC